MILIKSDEEIEIIRSNAVILGKCHAEVAKSIAIGVTTKKLDNIAFEFINDNKAIPSFLNYNVGGRKYPASLCISVNDVVVHGIPSLYEIKDGDIISIDCGVKLNGYHADSAYTYGVGNVSEAVQLLLKTTKESLYVGLNNAIEGKRIGDLGNSIQTFCESKNFTVVRELVGHGVGKSLHESPEVPNYGRKGDGIKLKSNTVIAIEPMINLGKKSIVQDNDGWTIRTSDKLPSAHFEHTVAVRKNQADILTTFLYIEEVIKESDILVNI
ncbi:MAG: type I methionyl aminopeptidase [Pseudarcicella sp.]|nr:type I methionyl aminopeptidase [Pseudarcicella sp.]MBP6409632.1 type I methionyl aminopeptidase [Pseudarcicella sp.]